MIVLLVVTATLLAGLAAAAVILRGRGVSIHAPVPTSTMGGGLPAGPIVSDDIASVRFDVVMRGYRMDQVDDALARLRAELADRDDEIALLRDADARGLRTVPPGQATGPASGLFSPPESPTAGR